MRSITVAAILAPLGLVGCAALPLHDALPVGTVQLNQELEVADGSARVFIQDGKVTGRSADSEFRTHCNFEVRDLGNGGSPIAPENFRVVRVQRLTSPVVMLAPRHVAGVGMRFGLGFGLYAGSVDGGDGPEMVQEGYHFWLESAQQAGVMRMSCHGTRDDEGLAEPPTRAEIDEALGAIATLSD